jgi:hypothetical protein
MDPVGLGNDGRTTQEGRTDHALTAEGALVYGEKISGQRPAVPVAPNWMGTTENTIARGKLVAGNRYVVLVANMDGQGLRPADFGEAAQLANPLRAAAAESRRRIRATLQTLTAEGRKRDLIDARRAAIGFCFGDGNVLELARDGADIAAPRRRRGRARSRPSFWWPTGRPIRWCPRPTATHSRPRGMRPARRCSCSAAPITPIPTKVSRRLRLG